MFASTVSNSVGQVNYFYFYYILHYLLTLTFETQYHQHQFKTRKTAYFLTYVVNQTEWLITYFLHLFQLWWYAIFHYYISCFSMHTFWFAFAFFFIYSSPSFRKNCFTTQYFKGCIEALQFTDEMDQIQTMIKQLHGAEPGV